MKPTILIIDDENNILRLLEYCLGKKFDVISASNGREALLCLQNDNIPEAIIADIQMPDIDGYEFIRNIRASGFFKSIPVIFLSAKAKSTDRIKGLRLGADDYMVKPFNPEELELRLDKILQRVETR